MENLEKNFLLAKKQDRKAQKALYEMFSAKMLAIANSYTNNLHDAEDILISAFMKCFTRLDECREWKSFPFWLRKIIVNDSINFVRKNRNILYADIEVADELSDEEVDERIEKFNIKEVFSQMPTGYRLIFNLYVFEEKKHQEIVKNAVLVNGDSLRSKNEMWLGLGGVNMKFMKGKKKDNPKFYLKTVDLSVSIMGSGLTSKNKPFNFYNQDSDTRNTMITSSQFALRYEDQIGGFKSPVFYRIGLGTRSDRYIPKYNKVFRQENDSFFIDDFDRGNLKKTRLNMTYLYMPVDLRFVLNPKYVEYEGVQYLDNRKPS